MKAPPGIAAALASALLFGITTPVAKGLLSGTHPLLIAGLLYLGSGVGVLLLRAFQDRGAGATSLSRSDWPWLAAATLAGGLLAPALLMSGLAQADAAAASLLLNLEVVFTAALAWFVFREPTSRRVVVGLLVIFAGGLVLVWPPGGFGTGGASLAGGATAPSSAALSGSPLGSLLAIGGACLCWALDNNLTRRISAGDPRLIAGIKGLTAGLTNTVLAFSLGAALPAVSHVLGTLVLGFLGYGVSLVLFIVALRLLGTARTSAYFATAPFIGAGVAIAWYGQAGGGSFWLAALCMGAGVWLHVTEHHEHEHVHEPVTHSHPHSHDDEHHRHDHGPEWDGTEPHTHEHRHAPLKHSHAHYPDIHHRHGHG